MSLASPVPDLSFRKEVFLQYHNRGRPAKIGQAHCTFPSMTWNLASNMSQGIKSLKDKNNHQKNPLNIDVTFAVAW